MRMQQLVKSAIGVAVAVALICSIHPLRTRLMLNDTMNRAFPKLPEEFRDDLESSMMLAPLAALLDYTGVQFLRFIRYPYLDIERRNSYGFDNDVQRRVFLSQERQWLAPKLGARESFPLADIESLRSDSLWQLGRAMYAVCHNRAGQQFLKTLDAPPELTRNQDPDVSLLRTVFWAAYGDEALQQAVAGS
jgi:hypothetical protein